MSREIAALLATKESEQLAFASPRSTLEQVGSTLCGMLNQQGGVLLWGVDSKRQPAGLPQAKQRASELNEYLMRQVVPRPLLSVSVHTIRGKEIIAVDVPAVTDKPYSLSREIWVRLGTTTLRASQEQSSRLVERSAATLERWEREPMPGFSLTDCDTNELHQARLEIAQTGKFGLEIPAADEDLLSRLYLYRSGQFSNAAVVLFARQPRAWSPNFALRLTTHSAKGEVLHDLMLEGPAIRMLREAVDAIQHRTGSELTFPKGRLERVERSAYPLYALREGLVNAIVHRDYTSPAVGVQVRLYPDRLIIVNTGTLPQGWKGSDLGRRHESHPANPDIARIFYLRGLMEQLGLGTQRIIAECKAAGAKAPLWKAENQTVSLTLFAAPAAPSAPNLLDRQTRFLRSLKSKAPFKISDYVTGTGVSERQARRDLAALEKQGVVQRQGSGPATHYLFQGLPS